MRKFSQREVGTIWRDRQFDKIRQELSKIVEKFRTWSNAWHTSSKHRNFSPRLRCFFVNVTFFIEFIILPYTRVLIESLIIYLILDKLKISVYSMCIVNTFGGADNGKRTD